VEETIQGLRAELDHIDKQLSEYKRLVTRRTRIAALIRSWEALYNTDSKKKQTKSARKTAAISATGTAGFAEVALETKGPMFIGQLLIAARELGWEGSGDDTVDKKRLYVAMHRQSRFEHLPDGKWKIREVQQARAAS
jgi:hypothetical protein